MHLQESSHGISWFYSPPPPPPPPVPSADGCFSACKWFIHWTSDYFFIILNLFLAREMLPGNFCLTFEENTPSFPRPDITPAVHVITRRLKEHTGFTETPGRLRTAHLLGQMTLFSPSSDGGASWMSPWMLAAPSMVSFCECGSIGYIASSYGRTPFQASSI